MKKNWERVDVVNLTFGHSLIHTFGTSKIPLGIIGKKADAEAKGRDTGSFGLFDTAAPNFVTYYPELQPGDLKPEEDKASFIYPVYRALSEVIVHKNINPIDFSRDGVLKAATAMLVGQTVYGNHEQAIGNEFGVIIETEWQDAYETKTGVQVPAGINAKFKIDGKANPKIARGIMMEPPSIHSCSVTVAFAWEPSHPAMNADEFRNKIGTYDEKGQMYRRIVTKIMRFHEISLVPHGADPFAQRVNAKGEIVNPEYAYTTYKMGEGNDKGLQVYPFSYKDDLVSLGEHQRETKLTLDNQNKSTTMNKELLALAKTMGIENVESFTDETKLREAVEVKLTAIQTSAAAVATLEAEKTTLTAEKATLTSEKTALEAEKTALVNEKTTLQAKIDAATPKVALHDTMLAELRGEVLRMYKLGTATPDSGMETVVNNADHATLRSLAKQYATVLEEKFPGKCISCGSGKITRQTSLSPQGGVIVLANEGNDPTKLTDAELRAKIQKDHKPKSILFGE